MWDLVLGELVRPLEIIKLDFLLFLFLLDILSINHTGGNRR